MSRSIIWEQLPDEPLDSYEAFCVFRNMPKRSIIDTERRSLANVSTKVGYKSSTQCAKWSAAWDWQSRAESWRKHQLEISLIVQQGDLDDFRHYVLRSTTEQFVAMDEVMNMKIRAMRAKMVGEAVREEDSYLEDVPAKDIKAILDAMDKLDTLKRRTGQMPTTYVKKDVEDAGEGKVFTVDAVSSHGKEADDKAIDRFA